MVTTTFQDFCLAWSLDVQRVGPVPRNVMCLDVVRKNELRALYL